MYETGSCVVLAICYLLEQCQNSSHDSLTVPNRKLAGKSTNKWLQRIIETSTFSSASVNELCPTSKKVEEEAEYMEHCSTLYIFVPTEKYLHNTVLKHAVTMTGPVMKRKKKHNVLYM